MTHHQAHHCGAEVSDFGCYEPPTRKDLWGLVIFLALAVAACFGGG